MTLVVAHQFGTRVAIMSESAIDDPDAINSNRIPGRLKSIVVHRDLSISYAGRSGAALNAIREVAGTLGVDADPAAAISTLCASETCRNGDTDFIVAGCNPPALHKIVNGQVMSGAESYWIGDAEAAAEVSRFIDDLPEFGETDFYVSAEELRFQAGFAAYIYQSPRNSVGGFVFNSVGTELGFAYQNQAGTFEGADPFAHGKEVRPGLSVHITHTKERRSGPKRWERYSYSQTSAVGRGVPLMGVLLPDGNLGFLFDPLSRDDPARIPGISLQEFSERVLAREAEFVLERGFGWDRDGNRLELEPPTSD